MRIHIVHGFNASPAEHWFPWLKLQLESKGHTASVLDLPSSHAPEPQAWVEAMQDQVRTLDKDTYFVSHSLGGIALLRFLERAGIDHAIGGFVLVSGFNAPLSVLPQLDAFAKPDLDVRKLARIATHRTVIASLDDAGVPHTLSETLAKALEARYVTVEQGGHFLGSEGFTEFPLMLSELERSFPVPFRNAQDVDG